MSKNNITSLADRTLQHLRSHADDNRQVTISLCGIAASLDMSRGSAQRAVTELKAAGLITQQHNYANGVQSACTYTINEVHNDSK